jgi:hypothetical protein
MWGARPPAEELINGEPYYRTVDVSRNQEMGYSTASASPRLCVIRAVVTDPGTLDPGGVGLPGHMAKVKLPSGAIVRKVILHKQKSQIVDKSFAYRVYTSDLALILTTAPVQGDQKGTFISQDLWLPTRELENGPWLLIECSAGGEVQPGYLAVEYY